MCVTDFLAQGQTDGEHIAGFSSFLFCLVMTNNPQALQLQFNGLSQGPSMGQVSPHTETFLLDLICPRMHLFTHSESKQTLELARSSTWWRTGAGEGDQNAQWKTPGVCEAD